MSVPDTNALPPAPLRMNTRTSALLSTSSHAASSASYIAHVIALRACGRLNVRTANGGSIWKSVSDTWPPTGQQNLTTKNAKAAKDFRRIVFGAVFVVQ